MSNVSDPGNDEKAPAKRNGRLIVVWSLMGAIATAIGLIAVFFPDLFNLQKNKINEFKLHVTGMKDFKPLDDFLMENRGRIVKLDISACRTLEEKCPAVEFELTQISFRGDLLDVLEFNAACVVEDPYGYGVDSSAGVHFNFDGVIRAWNNNEVCPDDSEGLGVFRQSGFYLVPEHSHMYKTIGEYWHLTAIPEKDLLLKKY